MSDGYLEKRKEWLGWLSGDPQHAIWNQINGLVWQDAVFRALNECRRLTSKDAPTAANNGMLAGFVDHGYVATQVLGISRLIDPRSDVISLSRLVKDLSRNRKLLTRENYLTIGDLPYDWKASRDAFYAKLGPEGIRGLIGLSTSGPDAWDFARMSHEVFDRLSAVSEESRSPTDTISEQVFRTLQNWLRDPALEKVRTLRHKFIAHAADAPSRAEAGLQKLGITLDEITAAHRLLFRVASAISNQILDNGARGSVIPVPQYDQFAHFDAGFVPPEKIKELHEWWDAHVTARDRWTEENFDLLTGLPDRRDGIS